MKRYGWRSAVLVLALAGTGAQAKVDLVTLPTRQSVQLTIYQSADMTLARERRELTLGAGLNRLEFAWANTLIDPTSLELLTGRGAGVEVLNLRYLPRVRESGVWELQSAKAGKVPVEIVYLTSGFAWRAFYLGTFDAGERSMRLEGYVVVSNQSGEDYEDAQVRLIVGQVHLLDQIAELARRETPYGRPGPLVRMENRSTALGVEMERAAAPPAAMAADALMAMPSRPKEIVKEGLSEYFLYTIEGTETIPHGWSKRLPSFNVADVPVMNLYRYEEERYGAGAPMRLVSFKNDKEHKLGQTPIPGGLLKVYRQVDAAAHLSYEGQSSFKYIPVDQDVELELGRVENVVVEPKLMDLRTQGYLFDANGNITGWEEVRQFRVQVKNTREVPVKVEVVRNFGTPYWVLEKAGAFGEYEQVDKDTVKFKLALPPRTNQEFTYTLTTRFGKRAE